MQVPPLSALISRLVLVLLVLIIGYVLVQMRDIFQSLFTFLRHVGMPFLLAAVIAYMLNPIVTRFSHRKVPRTVSVLLLYSVFVCALIVLVLNLMPMVAKQMHELQEHLPQFTAKAQKTMHSLQHHDGLPATIRTGIHNAMVHAEKRLSASITTFVAHIDNMLSTLFVLILVPFIAFYMLRDAHLWHTQSIALIPRTSRHALKQMLTEMDTQLGFYIRGQLIIALVVGTLVFLGYVWIGLPYALLLALCVAVFNVIPYMGPFLGAIPALFVASLESYSLVLLVLLTNGIVQILESNVLSPQIIGKTLHIHPLTVVFLLLVGGEIAGAWGLLFAVPLFVIGQVIVRHIWGMVQEESRETEETTL